MTPDRRDRLRRRADRWWNVVERAVLGLLVVLYLIGFISAGERTEDVEKAAVTAKRATQAVERVARASQDQFCNLVLSVHADRVRRLTSTREYLRTDAGREPTALNLYIRRISLPQISREVAKERELLPAVCLK